SSGLQPQLQRLLPAQAPQQYHWPSYSLATVPSGQPQDLQVPLIGARLALSSLMVPLSIGHPARFLNPQLAAANLQRAPVAKAERQREQLATGQPQPQATLAGSGQVEGEAHRTLPVVPEGGERSFEGRIEGRLVWPPRGGRGFGYDPIFVPEGFEITFGEMEPAEKHKISHRARAFAKLVRAVFEAPA
ncbi:MAG: hypothetical protein IH805_01750, partial [Proteobacteria bacterium]|nr:hypothetical protein [Pseudomonadota bacterium]